MGECITVKWRGKPVFIRSRTEDEIAEAANVNLDELRDPENDLDRVQNPETLVVLVGCVPINKAGDYNGWFCRCHRLALRHLWPDPQGAGAAHSLGLGPGASTQHSVLRGSMNSERPPESASSTPTGPGGSEGLQEGLGYFLFEFWRPFKHVNAFHVPVPSKDNMLPSRPLPPPPAAEARRQRVARAASRALARGVALWRTRPTLRRRPQRPILG